MNPSVTIRTKIRMEVAQKMKVWFGFAGPIRPMLNEPCQTTSSTETASTTTPIPSSTRFFMRWTLFDCGIGRAGSAVRRERTDGCRRWLRGLRRFC